MRQGQLPDFHTGEGGWRLSLLDVAGAGMAGRRSPSNAAKTSNTRARRISSRYKSSDWAERGFCGTCGSNLFYYLSGDGQYIINAGTLDDQSGLEMTSQVFIDDKPEFYDFANKTRMMTGAEVFALYAPPGDGEG